MINVRKINTGKTLVACLNGRLDGGRMVATGTFLKKDGMLAPIVCDHDTVTPLRGNFPHEYNYISLYC
jgi:hypothetical protein